MKYKDENGVFILFALGFLSFLLVAILGHSCLDGVLSLLIVIFAVCAFIFGRNHSLFDSSRRDDDSSHING